MSSNILQKIQPPLWQWPQTEGEAEALTRVLDITPTTATLLRQRGFADESKAHVFLQPKLQSLGDPFEMKNLRTAAERLQQAIANDESIVLYSDYDVDGVTSAALMFRMLAKLGAEKVRIFLPHRIDEGYGLTREGLERCLEEGTPKLLLALDCGTNSLEEIAWLTEQGIDVIVVDHHTLGAELLKDALLVNPHQDDRGTYFATVGLAFKLCHGLLKLFPDKRAQVDLREQLDLVATGTIADIVPLVEENRVLVHHGLQQLAATRNVGLRALQKVTGMNGAATPYDVGFKIGPRLNAMGRLGDALDALRLLITEDPAEAAQLAQKLDEHNRQRQQTEKLVLEAASARLELEFDHVNMHAVVIGERGWHPGVVGIVASRLQRQFYKPAIVIGFDDAGLGKGSARSIAGVHLADALRACGEHLERCGGHAMAAGLTIREEKLAAFCSAFNAWLSANVAADVWQSKLKVDVVVKPQDVTQGLWKDLQKLAPFGQGNPEPLLAIGPVNFEHAPAAFGKSGEHLKALIRTGAGSIEVVAFGQAHRLTNIPQPPLALAGHLRWDDYRGRVQIRLVEWKSWNDASAS